MFRYTLIFVSLLLSGVYQTAHAQLRLNQIQVIGSHNSYKEAIEPELLASLLEQDSTRFLTLEYEHISLARQVALGLRKLELDIFYDPEGGLLADPYGLQVIQAKGEKPLPFNQDGAMNEPGFKVLHVQDIDFVLIAQHSESVLKS